MNETADFFEQLELPCFFKENFGYECPGCGFQTAFVLLLRGRLWESIETYPPLPFLLFLFAFFIVHLLFRIKNGELIMHWAFRLSVAAVVINYIWKLLL
jgi:hypothetical protein